MSAPRQKTYAPRRFNTQEPALQGVWDGKRRPPLPAGVKQRQRPPYGGLSPEEFDHLGPEAKIAISNGEPANGGK